MSIITAGFEQGLKNAVERRAKRMAKAAIEHPAFKATVDEAVRETFDVTLKETIRPAAAAAVKEARDSDRELYLEFMRSHGISDDAIDAFIRQLPGSAETAAKGGGR